MAKVSVDASGMMDDETVGVYPQAGDILVAGDMGGEMSFFVSTSKMEWSNSDAEDGEMYIYGSITGEEQPGESFNGEFTVTISATKIQ